jgi:hypothetical protein
VLILPPDRSRADGDLARLDVLERVRSWFTRWLGDPAAG